MAKKEKTTKKKKRPTEEDNSGMSARDKMLARRKKLQEKGRSAIQFIKDGTLRVRLKNPGADEELAVEIIQFYRGQKVGTVISPSTFDEPCALMEKYQELKDSSDEDDIALAKTLVPKKRYIVMGIVYADEKGKKVDKVDVPILLTAGLYNDIIELYLDEEWGDMTDPKEGYDLKLIRAGKGQMDTNYSVNACKNSVLPKESEGKELRKPIDLEGTVRGLCASYEDTEMKLRELLNGAFDEDDDDEDERPSKKKKSSKSDKSSKKKKKKSSKYDDDLPY